jgi:hypothetical protein
MVHQEEGSAGFFGFILGALMAAMMCGVVLFATGNFATNSAVVRIESPKITDGR